MSPAFTDDVREKAIEALAVRLYDLYDRDTARGAADWPTESLATRDHYRRDARQTLEALGLVAVDPGLVEAWREAMAEAGDIGDLHPIVRSANAAICAAVLSQLRGDR